MVTKADVQAFMAERSEYTKANRFEDIEVKEGEIVRNISMNIRFYEGWDEQSFFNLKIFPDYENTSSVLIVFLHILWM